MKGIKISLYLIMLSVLSACVNTENQPEKDVLSNSSEDISAAIENHSESQVEQLIPKENFEDEVSIHDVDDVWQRIRMQLSFEQSDDERVERRIAWYMKHPNYMHTISDRAESILFYIVNEVEKRNLPIELALMPLIESDFDTQAYSHAHASGLWQLTPHIGKYFGTQINDWYDGRQDIIDSTNAALDFLEYLYERFDGNWLHVIAAYNTGEGRVKRAIRRNQRVGKSTSFFELRLPKETRHFVPKLLAVVEILEKELMHFPAISNDAAIQIVDLPREAIVPDRNNWLAVEALNPGYIRFPALLQGPKHIVLPIERVDEWQQMMQNTTEVTASDWLRYQIRPGDTLSQIAQRYEVSVAQIRTFNDLNTDRITAGKHLYLPLPAETKVDYKVKAGDSLWVIARRFDVTISKLKQWNQLSSNTLQIGKTLSVYLVGP